MHIANARRIAHSRLVGNRLVSSFFNARAKKLVYLEVAGCQLSSLPHDLVDMVPNVRVLNLNYNFLVDLDAINGLEQLRKLTVIGSRVNKSKTIVKVARRLPNLEMLDCRSVHHPKFATRRSQPIPV
jgi:protein NUD1